MTESKPTARVLQYVPKITSQLIAAAFDKKVPYQGQFFGRAVSASPEDKGPYSGTYHKFLGEFACVVEGVDGKTTEYRSSAAIFPAPVEAAILAQMKEGGANAIVEFAYRAKCVVHPSKPNLTMWTAEPLLETQGEDRLGKLIATARAK